MSESNETGAPASGEAAPEAAKATAVTDAGAAPAGEGAESGPSIVTKLKTHPKVQQAISVAKEHPLGAVVGVAAAAALVEVEFAVGILTGLGATALLATKSGPEARREVLTRGKRALAAAREQMQKRRKPKLGVDAPPPPAP